MAEYTPRVVDAQLDRYLRTFAAISIDGARGVGKTRTARRVAHRFVPFDDQSQREWFLATARNTRPDGRRLVLDEWQRAPETWDIVRRSVDDGAPPGTYLLTGSVNRGATALHSGAGRIANLHMRPMALTERLGTSPTVSLSAMLQSDLGQHPLGTPGVGAPIAGETALDIGGYVNEIIWSGFPGCRSIDPFHRQDFLRSYLEQLTQHDLPEGQLRKRHPQRLLSWLRVVASQTAQTTPWSKITQNQEKWNDASATSRSTTIEYRRLMQSLWILDELPGWTPDRNELSKANQAAKHHLVDPALAAVLVGATLTNLMEQGEPIRHRELSGTRDPGKIVGNLLESLAAQSVRVYAQSARATVSHLSTKDGHEVDLIVEGEDGRVVALEVKANPGGTSNDTKHVRWLHERIGPDLADAAVLTTGQVAYRGNDGIARIPLALLGP